MKNYLLIALGALLFSTVSMADGIKFNETMSGYGIYEGIYRDIDLKLDIRVEDLDEWKNNPSYEAPMSGDLLVDGVFANTVTGYMQIFAQGNAGSCVSSSDCYHLVYWLKMNDGSADDNYFVGFKTVRNDGGLDIIDDMTTLQGCFTQDPYQPLQNYATEQCDSKLYFEWWSLSNLYSFTTSMKAINTPWWRKWLVPGKFLKIAFGPLAKTYFPWIF